MEESEDAGDDQKADYESRWINKESLLKIHRGAKKVSE